MEMQRSNGEREENVDSGKDRNEQSSDVMA
jgi:hypothetical protein